MKSDTSQILSAFESEVQHDHGDRPLMDGDRARIWRHAGLDGVELFQGSYQNYEFARHFHRVPAIGVVDRGAMSFYCRSANHVLGRGTVLLLNPGETHAPSPADSLGWSFRVFYLDKTFLKSMASDASMQTLRFKQPFVEDRELASSLFRLHVALERDGDRLHFESLLCSIFSRAVERYSESVNRDAEPELDKTSIGTALQYMEANYRQNLSLAELAALSPYGASHFLRMFKEIVGLTPRDYLTQFRIEMATSLLQLGMPLVDVAYMAGFTDQSHFTKKFKRVLGVTPGQYMFMAKTSGTSR
ncbi:AraC family transcriptional regulator [Edaphobacter dinghuensis]|uniref:AraC family transcriptional regulator n=1 Tax=Edaphobacter dinghuensis TaxID=1560005 RepID=A0A917M384_9BACT|nr:AraC family transcriptional regulator [Edaphobacter dinghuensis]